MKRLTVKLAIGLWLLAVACGGEKLSPLGRVQLQHQSAVDVNARFCNLNPSEKKSKQKIIFIVDKSGSNQLQPGGEPGTDPNGARRYTPMLSYLQGLQQDNWKYFSLINFSTTAQVRRPTGITTDFTNNLAAFVGLIQYEANPNGTTPPVPSDGGWTEYTKALGVAHDAILADATAERDWYLADPIHRLPVESNYLIIFVSDGYPLDSSGQVIPASAVMSSLQAVMNLPAGVLRQYIASVVTSTGYYYNTLDAAARTLLQQMAQNGNGQAFEFSAGQAIDFNQFAAPSKHIQVRLQDAFVFNLNSVWDKGEYLPDTDGDSLSDLLEADLKSKPDAWDSDANGVSDAIEYRVSGKACKDPGCNPAGAEIYPQCNSLLIAGGGPRRFRDEDRDGLNDCEEFLIGSLYYDFDSNKDGASDFFSLRFQLALIPGLNEIASDGDFDGKSNYWEYKHNTPPQYPNDKVLGLKPMDISLTGDGRENGQDCYKLEAKGLQIFSENDTVAVELIDREAVVGDRKYRRLAQAKASGSIIRFQPADFKQ